MPSNTFAALGLTEPLLRALEKERFVEPTPIQASAIPHLLAGHDLLGIAQTGTGKTAAFALPMLQHLISEPARPARFATRALWTFVAIDPDTRLVPAFRVGKARPGLGNRLPVRPVGAADEPHPAIVRRPRGLC